MNLQILAPEVQIIVSMKIKQTVKRISTNTDKTNLVLKGEVGDTWHCPNTSMTPFSKAFSFPLLVETS